MLKLEKPKTTEIAVKAKEVVKKLGKRNAVIILSVLVIGGAVALNIALFSKGTKNAASAGADTGISDGNKLSVGADTGASGANSDSAEEYFATAQVERKRSRDEAIEVLQLVVDNPEALEESKSAAMAEISQIAADIESESKIEQLVNAKGFEKCIAVISDSKCNVIVKTEDTLLPNQVAQIYEIVYESAGILPVNCKVIERASVPAAETEQD